MAAASINRLTVFVDEVVVGVDVFTLVHLRGRDHVRLLADNFIPGETTNSKHERICCLEVPIWACDFKVWQQ